ncbi:Y-family DNA polymerase [Pseudothauera rhizosphaerae]|uniref:DNA polymerase Y family protein n=1 Tax=Pseudothauera rhizosphaerae TaxID=2565932 RepID=A0A4S4AG15_9RHOO|nr:DNA polymerase Y family protein [Pseudothauera rhizosphaerae]THF58061.1 DNA polymerase Y family protein [Pseudothauera rhizosphaerae]
MLWLALLLPDLPLQVFTRGAPEAGLLAVVESHPRQRIVAASPAARALGVNAGDSVAAALAVAPDLLLRPRVPALEAATLEELAAWAGHFTPHVSLDPPGGLVLEISASLRLFGGLPALARMLVDGLAALGLHAALAAAPTPLAARWLAACRPGELLRPRTGWQDRLAGLPLGVLVDAGVGLDSLDLLLGIGVRSLGDVQRLPRAGLARRQAGAVSAVLARARGEAPDLRNWFVPPARYTARVAMAVPTDNVEPLLFAARRLFAGLAAWLVARQAAVDHCHLHLEHESGPATVLELVTGAPSRDEARLGLLARERLAALPLPAPVEALHLESGLPVALAPRSDDLFGDPDSARENAGLLLDRLRARLGADAVTGLRPYPDHRPERAWRPLPPGARQPVATTTAGPRPLWLLPEPKALGGRAQLTLLAGPERIESGWWDEINGGDVRRDYYVAADEAAALCWVFHPLDAPGEWYVHGYFG